MLKIAIVGCGKIADSHLEQLRRIPGCQVVAAADREPLMAGQLAERFRIPSHFTDVSELLSTARPDVVHVTTPPQSHFEIAKLCLESGSHVYVEKPFTLNAAEAADLLGVAERTGHKITVGHDLQYSQVMRRMRQLVHDGFLGGAPLHMESYYCYDLSNPRYARALLSNKQHWVRKLPGKLLHNIISHGIARIAEFLSTTSPQVIAHGFTSPPLADMGEREIIDELRVIIADQGGPTAYFTFSSQMRPSLNAFRIYGPKNGLVVDEDHQTLVRWRGVRLKSYAEKFLPPLMLAGQQCAGVTTSLRLFLKNQFHMKSGMKYLIEAFYRSVLENGPPPIAYREILLISRIMDSIFEQLAARAPEAGKPQKVSPRLVSEGSTAGCPNSSYVPLTNA